jgi:hypothetical protein
MSLNTSELCFDSFLDVYFVFKFQAQLQGPCKRLTRYRMEPSQ